MNKIDIIKTVGGVRISSEINNKKNNFFVVEDEELQKIKELEGLCLEVTKLQARTSAIKNITNMSIIDNNGDKRIALSIDTISLEGVLIESNHRYSIVVKDKLIESVLNIEKMVESKSVAIESVDVAKLRAILEEERKK